MPAIASMALRALLVVLTGALLTGASTHAADHVSRLSIAVIPDVRAPGGVTLYKVRVSGVDVAARSGLWKDAEDALFIFPGQTKPCSSDVYGERALQNDGQGFQYRVTPGRFSFVITAFANNSWHFGHVCAYLAPVNFALDDLGGLPLGPIAAHAQVTINVRKFGNL